MPSRARTACHPTIQHLTSQRHRAIPWLLLFFVVISSAFVGEPRQHRAIERQLTFFSSSMTKRIADDSPGRGADGAGGDGGGSATILSSCFSKSAERIPTHRRKRRCWQFHVSGITRDSNNSGFDIKGKQAAVLASFREKYTATKRLSFSPTTGFSTGSSVKSGDGVNNSRGGVVVEVQFTGPQPGEGPAGLLRGLLYGTSVEARPVKLRRGRKKNLARADSLSSGEASNVGSEALPGCSPNVTVASGSNSSRSLRSIDISACNDENENDDDDDNNNSTATTESILSPIYDDDERNGENCFAQGTTLIKAEDGCSVDLSTCCTEEEDHEEPALSDHESFWGADLGGDSWGLDFADDPVCGGGDLSPTAIQSPLRKWPLCSTGCEYGALESGSHGMKAVWDRGGLCLPKEGVGVASAGGLVGGGGEATVGVEGGSVLGGGVDAEEVIAPVGKVAVGSFREECDFDGRRRWPSKSSMTSPVTSEDMAEDEDYIVIGGLGGSDQFLRSLIATVQFQIDPVHRVDKTLGPIQVGDDGRAHAAVLYPSMKEIWPEMYLTKNVRVVEVDATLKVRSRQGQLQFVGQEVKVTYRRVTAPRGDAGQTARRTTSQMCARFGKLPCCAPTSRNDDPMVF